MAKSDTQVRSLFDLVEPSPKVDASRPTTSSQLARNFVRWCCSFGGEFRNSPDDGNLRFWAGNAGVRYKPTQETQILKSARELYLKRIVRSMSKSQGGHVTPDPPLAS